jgi:SAM-dependent methyltransferase
MTIPERDLSDEDAKKLPPGAKHYMAYVGPPHQYDLMGASQFALLITLGLRDAHRVLDFGCGSLRLGRLLIPYLARGKYTGLEPNKWLVTDALDRQLGREIVRVKGPHFFYHDDFRADRCGGHFDFIIAQSIFSHAGADLITIALSSFFSALLDRGLVLLTVLHPGQNGVPETSESGWFYPACVAHRPETLACIFANAGFPHFRVLPWFHPRQTWYVLAKKHERLPPYEMDRFLSGAILNVSPWKPSTER